MERSDIEFNVDELLGRKCWIGMDLSMVDDLTAICAVFPMDNDTYRAIWRYYLPNDNIIDKERSDRVSYSQWAKDGYLTLTTGNVIDYDYIENDLLNDWAKKYQIQNILTDPYNSTQLSNHLIANGLKVTDFRQGYLTMSPATKALERVILSNKFIHHNPISDWMIGNCEILTDPAGNIKLNKQANISRKKIDGIIAAIEAFGGINSNEIETESVYESREMIVL